MPEQWIVSNMDTPLAASTGAQDVYVNLPVTGLISRIANRIDTRSTNGTLTTLGGAGTITVNSVRLVANGNFVLWDTSGTECFTISEYDCGEVAGSTGASSTTPAYDFTLSASPTITPRNPAVVWPARSFTSLQLIVNVTTSQSSAAQILHTTVEELQTDAPAKGRLTRKVARVGSFVPSASLVNRQRLPRGGLLRNIFVHSTADANQNGGNVRVLLNNGALVPVNCRWDQLKRLAQTSFRFDNAAVPVPASGELMVTVGFDYSRDLSHLLDTTKYDVLELETTCNSSGTDSNAQFIVTDEIYPI